MLAQTLPTRYIPTTSEVRGTTLNKFDHRNQQLISMAFKIDSKAIT